MNKKLFLTNIFIILTLITIISIRIINLKVIDYEKYNTKLNNKINNLVELTEAPRGRILDTNGVVLVDNQTKNIITYRNTKSNTSIKSRAQKISKLINYQTVSTNKELINYYYSEGLSKKYITNEEQKNFDERKITVNELIDLQKSRITQKDLEIYNDEDKITISLITKMNNGYSFDTKIIKDDVSNDICAKVKEANIDGFNCITGYKRIVLEPLLSSIYGSVGAIPSEEISSYLDKDYKLNDSVGISYLEKQYDKELKGINAKYTINKDNSLSLYQKEQRGKDLVLALDINLVKNINEIITKYLIKSKTMNKTDYFNSAYVLVSNTKTGEIISMNGLMLLDKTNNIKEVTSNILYNSYTVGSVIKGASMSVGYLNNVINPGEQIKDSCVKLHLVPEKCSFKDLGMIDDIEALKMSSNYYQFLTAIHVANQEYKFNMDLEIDESDFNKYRDVFKKFGLGTTTGIDMPGEKTGIKGNIVAPDLYLNLAIGQYDNYTALGLLQYINTIANNGTRYKLSLKKTNPIILSDITNKEFFNRIQEGLYQVVNEGTGLGYTNKLYKPVGKTGTSETYYNKNVTTITQTYAMYAPYNDPKYSIVVITPNVSFNSDKEDDKYIAPINRLISKEVSELVFSK